jgi:hypothetical protein
MTNQPDDPEDETHWEEEVREEADANGGVVNTRLGDFFADEQRLVRLADTPAKSETPRVQTEALLNGLIEDCRFLIREVVYHSARLTPDAGHRMQFLASAEKLAITGAQIARSIAKLRQDRPPEPEENRYRMIIEHVDSAPVAAKTRRTGGRREGGKKTR